VADTAARGFPAYFDPGAWEEDLARTTAAGRETAEAARQAYEQDGIPFRDLRSVEAEGRDGTVLPDCAKLGHAHAERSGDRADVSHPGADCASSTLA
jgi:hypothetical protein